jgi:hypothetical protein
LRYAVFENLEVALRQIGRRKAGSIPHAERHVYQMDVNLDVRRFLSQRSQREQREESHEHDTHYFAISNATFFGGTLRACAIGL